MLLSVAGLRDVGLGVLAELGEEFMDAVDGDAALGQQFFHVAVGQSVAQVPVHRQRDDLTGEAKPSETRLRWRYSKTATAHQLSLPEAVIHQRNCPVNTGCGRSAEGSGAGVGKDDRRLYTCPQCHGSQVIVKWKRAEVDEEQQRATTELCPTCDGSRQILGPST
jgi:DnaJ-class molecular chaperone